MSGVEVARGARGAPLRGSVSEEARAKLDSAGGAERQSRGSKVRSSITEGMFRTTRVRGLSMSSTNRLKNVRGSAAGASLAPVLGSLSETVLTIRGEEKVAPHTPPPAEEAEAPAPTSSKGRGKRVSWM